MKKKLLLACLVGLLSMTSAYAKCDGGTEVTNSVGTRFCMGNVDLNWWSAFAWCKANSRTLATIYEMCPSWDGTTGTTCSEINNLTSGYTSAWTATVSGSANAYIVSLKGGSVHTDNRDENRTAGRVAFCR